MDNTPILVGVGQFTERVGDAGYQGLSPVELAVQAARQALRDCGVSELAVDVVATTRTFEDSLPQPAPFGKTDNFPRALARHLGSAPAQAYWEQMGGNTPQQLVNHFAERLARGQGTLVLLAGAEAISTVRHLLATGQRRDWNERLREPVDDQGSGWNRLLTAELAAHRLANIPAAYALLENARRARLQLDRSDYALQMGELFAPLTHVAAANPYSATRQTGATAHQLTTVTEHNRLIAEPYPLHLVARDQVNQAAALVLTTVAKARALRIDPRKWLYLNGYADLVERDVLDRPDLGAYPAGVAASKAALRAAHVTTEHVQFWDFYSCFPIAVSSVAQDGLGLAADNPRGLTVTGGLPYFGGPGNNYSMHAIATMAEKLRSAPGTFGFVGANGGFLSKYSVGCTRRRQSGGRHITVHLYSRNWMRCQRRRASLRPTAPPQSRRRPWSLPKGNPTTRWRWGVCTRIKGGLWPSPATVRPSASCSPPTRWAAPSACKPRRVRIIFA